jgi:uncharacterized membrane protein
MAAVAHLSFFTGFWLVAPLAIYAIKRKESRFVAFHALQAALVHVLYGMGSVFATVLVFVAGGLAAGLGHDNPAAAIALTLVSIAILVLVGMGWLVTHCVLAYGAWQGHEWQVPIVGRVARGILGSDEGAAKA